jgi:hypothetical protein
MAVSVSVRVSVRGRHRRTVSLFACLSVCRPGHQGYSPPACLITACLPHFPPAPPLRTGLGIKVKTPFRTADGIEHAVDARLSVALLTDTQAQRAKTGESQLRAGTDYIESGGAVGGACVRAFGACVRCSARVRAPACRLISLSVCRSVSLSVCRFFFYQLTDSPHRRQPDDDYRLPTRKSQKKKKAQTVRQDLVRLSPPLSLSLSLSLSIRNRSRRLFIHDSFMIQW